MPVELIAVLITVAVVVLVLAVSLWRRARRDVTRAETEVLDRSALPPEGVLVSSELLRTVGSDSAKIWEALETASTPIAVEYFPVTDAELTKYRTVPVNESLQKCLVQIIKAVDPKSPTLFRVVIPQGQKLVQAVGAPGWFRGWAHNGVSISSQALLKPVAAGGAIAAGWPVLAVAGTVMAVDMLAQREQRAYQRKVEALLDRHETREHDKRIAAQQSADDQLTRLITKMLDGQTVDFESAVAKTDHEFYLARQFLRRNRNVIDGLVGSNGYVDYRKLEEALGGKTKDVDYFISQLYLARAANALRRKALLADAAAHALAEPSNQYWALRKHFESKAQQLEEAEEIEAHITDRLSAVELKGRWYDLKDRMLRSEMSPQARQARLQVHPELIDDHPLGISRHGQLDLHGQHAARLKAQIDVQHPRKAAQHQTRARQ